MAASTRRARRRPVAAALTLTVVTGVGVVSVLPAYGFAAAAEGSTAPATSSVATQGGVVPVSVVLADATSSRDAFASQSPELPKVEPVISYRSAAAKVSPTVQEGYIGDDYPFKGLGLGMSSLSYGLQNCTDFVAWRLNRDAGSRGAPWLMPWSYLTPNGGDARQWKSAWLAHGWTVSSVPVVGSVAWFPGLNHVAYVARVNGDGTVLIEEYNNNVRYQYDTRTIAVSSATYLYAPPRPGQ